MSKVTHVDMLWTAGMDSTFRIVQLSKMKGVEVQPYYVVDKTRRSRDIEISRMNAIYDILLAKEETQATILKPILVDLDENPTDRDIIEAHVRLLEKNRFGKQYKFLATLAKKHPGLELSIERDEDEEYAFQKKDLVLIPKETPIGTVHVIDKEADPDAYVVFGNFHFPIATYTKADEIEYLKDGYMDVLNLTWHCHYPVKGEPCGYCTPCRQYIGNGLYDKIGPKGMKRYKYRAFYRIPIKIEVFFERLKSKLFKK